MITRRTLLGLFSSTPFVYLFKPIDSTTVVEGNKRFYYGLKTLSITSMFRIQPVYDIGKIEPINMYEKPEMKGRLSIVDENGQESFAEFDISNLKWIHN